MLVNLYKVTNDVNNLIYIGQTSRTIEYRWKRHVHDAMIRDGHVNKFHKAILEIGPEHFNIELIDRFDVSIIDDKEIEYIAKYDSFHNGYNSTYGGGLGLKISIEDRNKVYELYKEEKSRAEIARILNCSTGSVMYILLSFGIMPDYNSEPIPIMMYDKEFNMQKLFNSKREAYNYILENENSKCDKQGFYGHIKTSFRTGCLRYGHRWQLLSDLVYEDKTFRSIFDKEAYISGKQANKLNSSDYYFVTGAIDNTLRMIDREINPTGTCTICGKPASYSASMCLDCYNKQKAANIPDKETLQSLISKHSYEAIGRQYGVSGKAVRKWCDKYGLAKSRARDESGVTCVELNIHFNTFKEAAEYLVNNCITTASSIYHIAYDISKAKKGNKKYLGYTWI